MRPTTLMLASSLLLFAAGCGGGGETPQPGEACSNEGQGKCTADNTSLVCANGVYLAVPCKGAGGCTENDANFRCDQAGNAAGDACAFSGVLCSTANTSARLSCTSGIIVSENCPTPCSTSNNVVTCVNPDSMWRVQPASASVTATNNGSDWDGDSSPPDVYVAMTCPGDAAMATTAIESYTPSWSAGGCVAKAGDLMTTGWTFAVWDEDLTSNDTVTGNLSVVFDEAAFISGGGQIGESGGLQSMTVNLVLQ